MRRPTVPPTLSTSVHKPVRKPKFSQYSGQHDFTLEAMPVSAQPRRSRQTQGIALVVVLLSAMVLMVSLLAISATMTISSQRTTADQGATLQAQYAAEAGLARVPVRLGEIQSAMTTLRVPDGDSRYTVENHLRNFCGMSFYFVPVATPSGVKLCDAVAPGGNSDRYSLFSTYVPSAAYPLDTASASGYWSDIFSGTDGDAYTEVSASPLTSRVALSIGSEAAYNVRQGLIPAYVEAVGDRNSGTYRIYFRLAPTTVVGELKSGSNVVASRKLTQENSELLYITVSKPCFCQYMQYRDRTTQVIEDRAPGSSGQLSFGAGENFEGPVHTNETPGFTGSSTTNPTFKDTFTTAASGPASGSNYLTESAYSRMFVNTPPKFGIGRIELPENGISQLRAAYGGDPYNTRPVTDSELYERWRPPLNNNYGGVYYSQGNYSQRNTSNNWLGGIYIRDDVDQLKLCAKNNLQIIGVKQGNTTTTFQENSDGTWSVRVKNNSEVDCSPNGNANGSEVKRLGGEFNGMIYIDGSIADLQGDGSDNPDVAAKSKLMLTSTGGIVIKDDITYTDNPLTASDPNAVENVLGIYASGDSCAPNSSSKDCDGSIELDGASNKDLNIHATLMASRAGEGFGTLNCTSTRTGCPDKGEGVRVNLIGGVIESQSQTVSSNGNGYRRNYRYDKRFRSGFTPPFFPTQRNWDTSIDDPTRPFNRRPQVWQTVRK